MTSRGGRRDKYPQFFSGTLTESSANTFTTNSINVPTNLLQARGNRRTIIEVLWINLTVNGRDGATASVAAINFSLGSTPVAFFDRNDPRAIATFQESVIITTSGLVSYVSPVKLDMQTKDGFGYLLAADRFHVSIVGTSQTAALTVNWRMYYREVSVSVMEYVGIVQQQSQQ